MMTSRRVRPSSPRGQPVKNLYLEEGARLHQREDKTFANHVREGQRKGMFWETLLPVTDPQERQARERGRRSGPNP